MKSWIVFRLVDMMWITAYVLFFFWHMLRTFLGNSRRASNSKPVST
jgi:hypothetical protein